MSQITNRLRGILPLLLSLVALPVSADEVLQSIGVAKPLALVVGSGNARVERTNGARTKLPLRPGDRLTSFAAMENGWVAAGVRPRREGTSLLLYSTGSGGMRSLPAPRGAENRLRDRPTLLAGENGVSGLVWLEGSDWRSLTVRSAEWTGSGWKSQRTISPPARGSQTSLTATVLEDGTWIAAWSRFDGRDDEIYWSMRQGTKWTKPRPVAANNSVPDVTPVLTAIGDTAMLAWCRYDGQGYRTVLASLQKGGWSLPRTVGPSGSVTPTFSGDSKGNYLIFRTVEPSGWTALKLGAAGRPEMRAIAITAERDRPVVLSTSDYQVTLNWPDKKETLRPRLEIIP